MLNRQVSFTDKRRSKRENRHFKVRISGRTYEGFDVSKHGFSVRTSRLDIPFIKNKVVSNIFVNNLDGGQYLINEAKVVSLRETSTICIWGFEITKLERPAPHLMLIEGKSSSSPSIEMDVSKNVAHNEPRFEPLHKALIERMNRIAIAAHSEMITDEEFRALSRNITKDFL